MRPLSQSLFLLFFFVVASDAAVTGVVVHEDGSPVVGASVRAYVPLSTDAIAKLVAANETSTPVATATTADDGRFSLDAKGNPTVHLVITSGDAFASGEAADGDDAGAIVMSGDAKQPRVTAGDKAAANALVVATDIVLRADEQGRFPAALGLATIVAPEYAIPFFVDSREDSVALSRGVALRGKVVGPDKTPVADAVVSLRGIPLARTASDGTFTIAHAPEQWRVLTVRSAALAATVTNARGGSLAVHLRPAVTVSGTVTSARGPVAGARVMLISQTGDDFRFAITDAKGHYAFDGAVPAAYSLRALHPSFAVGLVPLTVTTSTSRDIRLGPLARISGHVVGEENKPVAGALVSSPGAERLSTLSGRGGEYLLRVAHTNGPSLVVVAGKSGYAMTSLRFPQFNAGEEKSNVTLKLQHGFPLQVKVIDRDRVPMADARVELVPSNQDPATATPILCSVAVMSPCRTGKDGLLEMRVPEGKYDVHVAGDNVTETRLGGQTLTPRTSPLIVTVDHALEASGTVAFDDGTPAPNARVTTRGARQAPAAMSDAKGNFTLKGLPHGTVTVYASSADDPPLQSNPVTVEPPARNVRITFPRPAGIEGRVIDSATTQPVTSFSIRLAPKQAMAMVSPAVAVTSDDGTFSLTRITPGQFDLHVEAQGYVAGTMSDISVDPGRVANGIEVKLDRAAHLAGHVTAGGKPVAGARVRRDGRGVRFGPAVIQTDDGGEYQIDVPPGEQTIAVEKEGFIPARKTITADLAKENRLDIELDRGREVQGRVVDKQGSPIAGASIMANGGMYAGSNVRATSGDDGSFTLSGLDAGTHYNVFAQKQGYVTANVRDFDPTATQPLTIALDHGGTITGHVRGLSEAELGEVDVRVFAPGTWASGRADSSGNFSVSGVPDGNVTVRAAKISPPMRESSPKEINVVNGAAPPVEIDFTEGISIRGRVTRNATPVTFGNVNFIPRRGNMSGAFGSTIIGADGSYEVAGLAPGDYDVRLMGPGLNDSRQYTVTGSATFDIDIQGGTVRGRVIDAATNAPLTETMLVLTAKPPAQLSRTAATDSDGRFSLDVVPDGAYTIRAMHDHYAPSQSDVTVTGGSAPEVPVTLSAGTAASIRVVDADSGVTVDAAVSIGGGPKKVSTQAVRGDDGAMKAWLDPGQYTVNVFARGYATTRADLTVPGPELRVPVSRGGVLSISSATGGMFTLLRSGDARASRGAALRAGSTIVIDSLASGVWIVRRMSADGQNVLKEWPVTIASGQTATLAVD